MLLLQDELEIPKRRAPPCRVVPFCPGDEARVVELQRHLWSPDTQLNSAYLKWKYFQNPYIRDPLVYLAFVGDKLAGMRGVFGMRWEVGDPAEILTLPHPDDLVIDPVFRERGLHRVIMNFALDDLAKRGYRYVVNLSASEITHHASLNMGWRRAGGMMLVRRRTLRKAFADAVADRMRRLPLLWRWANDFPGLGGAWGDRLFRRFDRHWASPARSRRPGALFAQATPLLHDMEQLVARLPKNSQIRHVRDHAYFEWRFRNPMRSYRYLYAGGDRIEGYLVLQRPLNGNVDQVSIVDWEAESEPVLEALLDAAIEHGRFPALCAWRLGASRAVRRILDRHGLAPVKSRHEYGILVRSVRNAELDEPWMLGSRPLDDASQWDMRMIYSMAG
jgi:GNAT superfamily N-acetyltransferase